MRMLGLDLGDKWVGVALADPLGITCKPYKTIQAEELFAFLPEVITKERVSTIVIGHPKTCSGGQSEQTIKVEQLKTELEEKLIKEQGLPITIVLWDERLSSKRAGQQLASNKKISHAEAKQKNHSLAAAFILQSYLDCKAFQKSF